MPNTAPVIRLSNWYEKHRKAHTGKFLPKGTYAVNASELMRHWPAFSGPLVMTAHPYGCVVAYTPERWEVVQGKLRGDSSILTKVRRFMVSFSTDVRWRGGAGYIHEHLLQYAGIESDALLRIVDSQTVELWQESRLAEFIAGRG